MKTTSTQRNQKRRAEAKAKGLVRYGDKWVTPEQRDELKSYADKLRARELKKEMEK